MANTINPALYTKHRAIIDTWNLMGKKMFTVKTEPVDLKWNDKVRENEFRTSKAIMKYMIEGFDVYAVELVELPDHSAVVIQLNHDVSLQFKLAPAQFREVTMEAIAESIEKKDPAVRQPILFRDGVKLADVVRRLNLMEMQKCDDLAEELLNTSKFLSMLNKEQDDSMEQYYQELGEASL